VVALADGRKIATPLTWYPRLQDASAATRCRFELMPMGIHWPELDEDLGIAGMLRGRPAAFGEALLLHSAPGGCVRLDGAWRQPAFFLLTAFRREGVFAAAFLRVM
jgi:hypothetical protein